MAVNQGTNIPTVPVKTPMFDADGFTDASGNLARTWIIFFEQLRRATNGGGGGPYQRTLLLKDTSIQNDVADHVTVYGSTPGAVHTILSVTGVLRKAIATGLVLRINNVPSGGGTPSIVGSFTIPSATAIDTVINFPISGLTTKTFKDGSVLTWDVTASGGTRDPGGVASFTIEWD